MMHGTSLKKKMKQFHYGKKLELETVPFTIITQNIKIIGYTICFTVFYTWLPDFPTNI